MEDREERRPCCPETTILLQQTVLSGEQIHADARNLCVLCVLSDLRVKIFAQDRRVFGSRRMASGNIARRQSRIACGLRWAMWHDEVGEQLRRVLLLFPKPEFPPTFSAEAGKWRPACGI